MSLPARTADTMSMVIGMTSPNGRMSKAARTRSTRQLEVTLFGEEGFDAAVAPRLPAQPSEKDRLSREAKNLRDLAARGMKVKAFTKRAEMLEAKIATL